VRPPKKRFHLFFCKLWAPLLKSNNVGRHFRPNFQGFCSNFQQIKSFRGALVPPPPTPLLPHFAEVWIVHTNAVFLKVGGIAILGAILMGKGAKKVKEAIGGRKNTKGAKMLNHYLMIELPSVSYYYELLVPCKF